MVYYKGDTSERRKQTNKQEKQEKTKDHLKKQKNRNCGQSRTLHAPSFCHFSQTLKFVTTYKDKCLIQGVPFMVLQSTQNTNLQ